MTPALEKKLYNRFKFFHPNGSIRDTLMVFGFDCEDGWFKIIWDLSEKINEHLKKLPEQKYPFEVVQVKEKFASLRYYTNWDTDEISDMIREAEILSQKTCEICGKIGEVRDNGGWLRTLCNDCNKLG